MLKKAGLITAASVAALVAVSPLAFATDGGHVPDGNQNSAGVVNGFNGNNVNAPLQACNNDVDPQGGLVPVQDVGQEPTAPLNGAAGLLGDGSAQQGPSDTDHTRACGQKSGSAGYGH